MLQLLSLHNYVFINITLQKARMQTIPKVDELKVSHGDNISQLSS